MIEFYFRERIDKKADTTLLGFVDMAAFVKWVKHVGPVKVIPGKGDEPMSLIVER